jgi:hypothetical protein
VPAGLLAADLVAGTWREHLRANPVPRGQQVLFLRYMLAADGGEATTPAHAALILDLKRRYLEMRGRAAARRMGLRLERRQQCRRGRDQRPPPQTR